MRGKFITFEGPDGTGKTTQIKLAAETLRDMGYEVLESMEPGGTKLAEKVRDIVLDPKLPLNNITEILLYLAARSEHTEKILAPALDAGKMVLCDRFGDSTLVYQGLARGLENAQLDFLKEINDFASCSLQPDLTLVLDGSPEVFLSRRTARGVKDRYENRGLAFQEKIREGFLTIAASDGNRIKVIDAEKGLDTVHAAIMEECLKLLKERE
ncbi:MAG: dTMP kinase [Phascolarctobacterium sp.]|nr:dTMP kinase [Phascolarctobacterium sp.]